MAARRATSSQLVVTAVSKTSAASWKVSPATSHRPSRSQTSRSWWPSRDAYIVRRPWKKASIAPTTMRMSASQSMTVTALLPRMCAPSFARCGGSRVVSDPVAVANAQVDLFNEGISVWRHAAERVFLIGESRAEPTRDKRFKHPDWTENALFSFIRESYLVAAKSLLSSVRDVKGLDPATGRKVDFYTRQFVDALSPSNFIATNPEVLTTTLETGGQNLLHGLENLLADLDRGDGRLAIAMTDMKSFRLGENIAATPGKVVYQTG